MTRPAQGPVSLDPEDWDEFRALGHRMLDDMLNYIEHIRERAIWQPMPDAVRKNFRSGLPRQSTSLQSVYDEFSRNVLPHALGNVHPGFMGWVHGGGTAVGMLADMLSAGMNVNAGGRDQAAIEVERQIVEWARQIFEFPFTTSGVLVTGTSMANLLAVLVARTAALGTASRQEGIAAGGKHLTAYTSKGAHGCLARCMEVCGLGSDALRAIDADSDGRINMAALSREVAADRGAGLSPFLVIATAGTVDVGAIDPLDVVASFCRDEGLWFHVDGAFGALAKLAADLAPRLKGIESADSIAFDFHKWAQVPYDAGFLLVRDAAQHLSTFSGHPAYLRRENRGMAAGSPWPCDFGVDLSRGFRALKVWFTIKTFGAEQLGAVISQCCELARYLESRVREEPRLELLAPVQLNIVCFRYRFKDMDRCNSLLAVAVQESGVAAPSTTLIDGKLAIRAAIVNHRSRRQDVDALVDVTLKLAAKLEHGDGAAGDPS
jgi:aromatic-L-amino-acid/L-tryptophan decarboxylase